MTTKQTLRTESLTEAAAISAVELFRDLPKSCLEMIREKSEVREFAAGHVFFRPGESGQLLFLLEQGHVQTFRTSGRKKLIIAELRPPAVFGEMGCVGQCMYHCAAQTTEASRIRMISRDDMDALLDQHPQITRRLLDLISERFVHLLLVVNWHRAGFRLYWTRVSRVRQVGGRKRFSKEVRASIFRMVSENPTWGAPRIHGELLKLGFDLSERSVSRWMRRAPRDPDSVKRPGNGKR